MIYDGESSPRQMLYSPTVNDLEFNLKRTSWVGSVALTEKKRNVLAAMRWEYERRP